MLQSTFHLDEQAMRVRKQSGGADIYDVKRIPFVKELFNSKVICPRNYFLS